jgi:hypothetical protein
MQSVFADKHNKVWTTAFWGSLLVGRLVAGIPSDPRVAEGWIKKNLGADNADLIQEMVAKTMIERGVEMDVAVDDVVATTKLSGFKRDDQGVYIEGRQLKACIKESANQLWPKRRWGPTSKGTLSYWAERVQVVEDRLHLGMADASGIKQHFVHTWRGSGIQYAEYADDAKVPFTIESSAGDCITDDDWAELWANAEMQGVGAERSMGFGRFVVTKWERVR